MGKKYIKDENGLVRSITTETLQLEKPLVNEFYDINVFNNNMDKIEKALKNVSTDAKGTSFDNSDNGMTATNVQDAIEENKTSILSLNSKTDATNSNLSNLQTKVNNGQIYKITNDNGFTMQSSDCNNLNPNIMCYVAPSSLNIPHQNFNGYVETHCHGYEWGLQEAYDCFNTKKRYEREIINGVWQPWRLL